MADASLEDDFLADIATLGRQESVVLALDDSEAGAEQRRQQRQDELESLRAIYGSDMVEDGDVLRFEAYRELVPTQPGAPLERIDIAFLLHEQYPSFPVVLELQGPCLRFDEADAVFMALLKTACDSVGGPAVFGMVSQARELVAAAIATRSSGLGASEQAADRPETPDTAESEESADRPAAWGLHQTAAQQVNNPGFFLNRSVHDVVEEINSHSGELQIVHVENVIRLGLCGFGGSWNMLTRACRQRSAVPAVPRPARPAARRNIAAPAQSLSASQESVRAAAAARQAS